jgi:hypothetical protein
MTQFLNLCCIPLRNGNSPRALRLDTDCVTIQAGAIASMRPLPEAEERNMLINQGYPGEDVGAHIKLLEGDSDTLIELTNGTWILATHNLKGIEAHLSVAEVE